MKIAIGADHRGFHHKEIIKQQLQIPGKKIEWIDVGAHDDNRSDYPVFVKSVCFSMLDGVADAGILLCGSGVGMSIAANRFEKIYAALVWNEEVARTCKEDDNANVLVIPADFVTAAQSIVFIKAWLRSEFKNGRYHDRLAMIDSITTK